MTDETGESWLADDWQRVALGVVLAVVVLLAVVIGAVWLYGGHLYRTSYESEYTYEVTLATDGTLTNATLYLPVPEATDAADLGGAAVERGTDQSGPLAYEVVETERGPMLAVSAAEWTVTPEYYQFVERNGRGERVEISESEYDTEDPSMVVNDTRSVRFEVTVPVDRSVDTGTPWAGEPLLRPRVDRRPGDCNSPGPDWLRCYAYESAVYASYDTASDTEVYASTTLYGTNAWWVFGWGYDEYRDDVTVTLDGPQAGWTDATGTLETDTDQRDPP
ncbi:hypothetical protein [Halorientalis regularis]|uniref:Uncharacterized protein n=1 Tax=Halorientalis regularis TaxID=660518 RepID=A0A1G7LVB7_9EURY|nr:hypothetical protein [Halorientalis regularis]SDF53452.1 hypothetical protein SAMN05216218_10738 [Halorientalis regularis]